MYGDLISVKRLLNPRPVGTISGAVFIGTSGSAQCGTTFALQALKDVGTFINGMLYNRYATPFGSPNLPEINWIANRLAASFILQACKLYIADSASNYLYDKQQTYYGEAMTKLQALADGVEILRGVVIRGPTGEFTTSDEREFSVPGSVNVRPAVGM